ncbi:uncharacterized protein [Chelonus insularis]|uniref:uncharacterized protein isoform X2 n=1 Tax=Chelonus insularis TaxID=460826 RepID=UPI0015895317|nr:uncharacterized protein LOC118067943 isoform X2 [Chelonus insularis]
MSIRSFTIIFFLAVTVTSAERYSGRRAAEYENSICEPNKKHLDLDGCGECICKSHGYGSLCEHVTCSRIYKRPIHERECTPFEDFNTYCHYCKCSASGIPMDCREKRLGCMDEFMEREEAKRFERISARRMRKKTRQSKSNSRRFYI